MPDALLARVGPEPSDRRPVHVLVAGDDGQPMPWPAGVLLVLHTDGPIAYRYARDGGFGGDTWHESQDAALRSLDHEYGSLLSAWEPVPGDDDSHEYAVRVARTA